MRDAGLIHHLVINLDPEEVWRALAVPKEGRRRETTARRLEQLLPEARALLHPRGAWRIVGHDAALEVGLADPPHEVAVAVCTISGELERSSAERAAAGDLLDALLLDAVGSAAAEATADALNARVCRIAKARTLYAAVRESPGYGDWDVGNQGRLLALLPAERLGIGLTAGGMMVPRKSVSFALRLLREPTGEDSDPCARCGRRDCRHRRTRALEH